MGINIGAFFAPSAATGVRNWWLKTHGLGYNANLPQLAHGYLNGEQVDLAALQSLANQVSSAPVTNLKEFAAHYIEVFGQGYHIAFGVAGISMVISLIIYLVLNKYLRYGDIANKKKEELPPTMQEISPKETRERLTALGLVFITVIFFWMAFHQNGLTLTLFARDYIREHVSRWSYIFFDLRSFLPLIFAIIGLIYALNKNVTGKMRFGGLSLAVASLIVLYFVVRGFNDQMPIEPEKFQHFNPIFIVFLTPVVVWFFGWLDQKGKEPSTPAR